MRLLTGILIGFLILLQYDLWLTDSSLVSAWQLEKQITLQQDNNRQLQTRNDLLDADVKDLENGQDAIEERARSELGMIKKDETFIQIIGSEAH